MRLNAERIALIVLSIVAVTFGVIQGGNSQATSTGQYSIFAAATPNTNGDVGMWLVDPKVKVMFCRFRIGSMTAVECFPQK
jgi:hypothetical protein